MDGSINKSFHTILRQHRRFVIVITLIMMAIVAGFVWYQKQQNTDPISKGFEALTQRASAPPIMRLHPDMTPPTNRWFSSLVFAEAQTAFAYPLSYRASGSGFELSVPPVSSQPDIVTAPHQPHIAVNIGTDAYVVRNYDDLSVTSRYSAASRDIADVTIAQGSPFVFLRAEAELRARVMLTDPTDVEQPDESSLLFLVDGQQYGIHGGEISTSDDGTSFELALAQGEHAAFFAIPEGAPADVYMEAARHPLEQTTATYRQDGNSFETTYRLTTTNGRPTLFGSLPHHDMGQADSTLGSFQTLYGELVMHYGTEFAYRTNVEAPPEALDLSGLSGERTEQLQQQLAADADDLELVRTDTYFGGKELYRAANLLQLADQLGEDTIRDDIRQTLRAALTEWFGQPDGQANRYFYYDRTLRGVVGMEPAFGSETFNDHHFHYGYFIHAASVLAKYDEAFLAEYGDMVDLLVADIANTSDAYATPKLRVYDRYTGHSWASGYADFHDGNNQESSSEAVQAWYAAYLWALRTENGELEETALWLYTNETAAAQRYWLHDQRGQAGFQEYAHPFVSLVWGGKRDFATFFSPRPQAMLGIQLLPMSPGHGYLRATDIESHLGSIAATGQFADYLLMYQALTDSAAVTAQAERLQDFEIDDANSRSYLHAWLYALEVSD